MDVGEISVSGAGFSLSQPQRCIFKYLKLGSRNTVFSHCNLMRNLLGANLPKLEPLLDASYALFTFSLHYVQNVYSYFIRHSVTASQH